MHQIYSCSDENLEVFTTVISSKCEYVGRVAAAAELPAGRAGGLAPGEAISLRGEGSARPGRARRAPPAAPRWLRALIRRVLGRRG